MACPHLLCLVDLFWRSLWRHLHWDDPVWLPLENKAEKAHHWCILGATREFAQGILHKGLLEMTRYGKHICARQGWYQHQTILDTCMDNMETSWIAAGYYQPRSEGKVDSNSSCQSYVTDMCHRVWYWKGQMAVDRWKSKRQGSQSNVAVYTSAWIVLV